MSQGNWGGGPGGGWGGGQPPGGGGYGPPGGGAPPGGGGYGAPPGGGGYGAPPGGGGYGAPPGGGGYGAPPGGGGYGAPPGGGGYGAPPGGGGFGGPGGGGFAPPPAGYPPGYSPQAGGGVVAWEDTSKGFFGRWWTTVKDVCFDARTFYAAAAQSDNPWPAVTFAMSNAGLVGLVFGVFLALIYMLMGGIGAMSAMGTKGAAGGAGAIMGIMSAVGIFVAILYPVMFVIQALIMPWIIGGVHHLMLVLMKGATRSYSHTVRVVGYAWAGNFWIVVPIVGPLAALVFGLIAQVVGLDETHKCGIGKAIGAIALPIVLCCLCYCGFSFLVGMMSAGSHR